MAVCAAKGGTLRLEGGKVLPPPALERPPSIHRWVGKGEGWKVGAPIPPSQGTSMHFGDQKGKDVATGVKGREDATFMHLTQWRMAWGGVGWGGGGGGTVRKS